MRFRVKGAGYRVQGRECRVKGAGLRLENLGFRAFRIPQGSGLRMQTSVFGVWGLLAHILGFTMVSLLALRFDPVDDVGVVQGSGIWSLGFRV